MSMAGIEIRNTGSSWMDIGGDVKVENWNGWFSFRQTELEATFRIQVKVSCVLLVTRLLFSLVLDQNITPLRTSFMFFSVIREWSHNFSNSWNCSSWRQIVSLFQGEMSIIVFCKDEWQTLPSSELSILALAQLISHPGSLRKKVSCYSKGNVLSVSGTYFQQSLTLQWLPNEFPIKSKLLVIWPCGSLRLLHILPALLTPCYYIDLFLIPFTSLFLFGDLHTCFFSLVSWLLSTHLSEPNLNVTLSEISSLSLSPSKLARLSIPYCLSCCLFFPIKAHTRDSNCIFMCVCLVSLSPPTLWFTIGGTMFNMFLTINQQ